MRRVGVGKIRGWGICTGLYGSLVLAAMTLMVGTTPRASAQVVYPPSGQPASSQGGITPVGEWEGGFPVADWMLFPSLYIGGVYNSNINQTPSGANRDSGGSARVAPRLVATHTDGAIHGTTIYGVGDFQFFNGTTVSADAGFSHDYKPTQDLGFNANFRYTRQTDLFTSALNFNNNAIGPAGQAGPAVAVPTIINPFGTLPSVNPIAYNQFTVGASGTKTFGDNNDGFVTVAGTFFNITYDQADNALPPFQTSHDANALWLSGRVGWHFVPGLYAFGEVTGIWQDYRNSLFDTNGYRILGGIGTDDANSLVRGEVYGGWQFQHQKQNVNLLVPVPGFDQNSDSGVFGGRVYYYPTQYITVIASLDEALSMSSTISPTIPAGTPVLVTTGILQATYALSRQWSIGGRVGFTRGDYFNINRLDTGWMVGGSFNYEIWRNLALTLDYQYSTLNSNVPFNDFTRSVASAGLTYRY